MKPGAPADRAGGSANFPGTFCQNPQFVFDVSEKDGSAELMLALSQRDAECLFEETPKAKNKQNAKQSSVKVRNKKKEPLAVIGMHLMRVELNRVHRIHQVKEYY